MKSLLTVSGTVLGNFSTFRVPVLATFFLIGSICRASDLIVISGEVTVQVIKITQTSRLSGGSKVFICANRPNENSPSKCQFEIELRSPNGQPLSEDDAYELQKNFKSQLTASTSPLDCRSQCRVIRAH